MEELRDLVKQTTDDNIKNKVNMYMNTFIFSTEEVRIFAEDTSTDYFISLLLRRLNF